MKKKTSMDELLSMLADEQALAKQTGPPLATRRINLAVLTEAINGPGIVPGDISQERINPETGITEIVRVQSYVICSCGRIIRASNKEGFPVKRIANGCGHATCSECSDYIAECMRCGMMFCRSCWIVHENPNKKELYGLRLCERCSYILSRS